MALCGPKLSICGMVLSVWGVVMLALMGIFLRIKAPAFADDLPIDNVAFGDSGFSMSYIDGLYNQVSSNCFIAAGIYVAVFVFSFIQHKLNVRANYVMS